MKITGIKKKNNKYIIKLEDESKIETYDEVIINNNILYKKEIDEKLKKTIEEENNYYDTYNEIVKLINKKLRSKKEIKEIMNKKQIEKNKQEKIIKELKSSNLINDKLYTKAYIHDRINFSNDGINKIKLELLNQEIDENIIDNEIETVNQEELKNKLEKLIIKKINTNTKYSDKILKQKITNYFTNLGYNKEDINEILEQNIKHDENIIKKEYDKLYNKYKTKYNEEQLKYTIKQKLYQKGFLIDEINEIIK
jgi:regulatory protein